MMLDEIQEGMPVLYIPRHAQGKWTHPDCQRGIVTGSGGGGEYQRHNNRSTANAKIVNPTDLCRASSASCCNAAAGCAALSTPALSASFASTYCVMINATISQCIACATAPYRVAVFFRSISASQRAASAVG